MSDLSNNFHHYVMDLENSLEKSIELLFYFVEKQEDVGVNLIFKNIIKKLPDGYLEEYIRTDVAKRLIDFVK